MPLSGVGEVTTVGGVSHFWVPLVFNPCLNSRHLCACHRVRSRASPAAKGVVSLYGIDDVVTVGGFSKLDAFSHTHLV